MKNTTVLEMIQREMQKKHIRIADIARELKMSQSSISGMMKRPTIQVGRLIGLCRVLQYNFFREIAMQLPFTEPDYSDQTTEASLQNRIQELEIENRILRQMLNEFKK